MFLTIALSVVYLSIATFAAAMTMMERSQTGEKGLLSGSLGLIACVLWPITFVTVAIAVKRSQT